MTTDSVSPPRTPTMRKVQSSDSPRSSAAFFGEAAANSDTASGRLLRARSTLDSSFTSTRSHRRTTRHEDDDLALAIRLSLEEAGMSRDRTPSPDRASAQQTSIQPDRPTLSSPPASNMDVTTHCSLPNTQSTPEPASPTAISPLSNSKVVPSDFAIVIPLHPHSNDYIGTGTNPRTPIDFSANEDDSDLTSLASEEDASVVGTQDTELASPGPGNTTPLTETRHDMAPRRHRRGDTLEHSEDDEPQQPSSPSGDSPPASGTRRASRRTTRKPAKYTFGELEDLPLNQDSDDDFEVLPKRPSKRGNNTHNIHTTRKKSAEDTSSRGSSRARASTPSPMDRDSGNDTSSPPDSPRRSTRRSTHATRGKGAQKMEPTDVNESDVTESTPRKRSTVGSRKRKADDSEDEKDGDVETNPSDADTQSATSEQKFKPESDSSDEYGQEEETEAEVVSSEDEYVAETVPKPKASTTGKRTLSQSKTATTPTRPTGARSSIKKKSTSSNPSLSPSTTRPTAVRKRPMNGAGGNLSSLLQSSSSPRAAGLVKRVVKPVTPGNTATALSGLTATPLRRVGLSRKRPAGPKLHAYLFNQTP
ncbi:hypothetical protein IWQ62_001942 [Dispira parvispora]|uniref:Uncharacterized protein n=1 Tax=Dispira parvispora TaxID=1520584 RepID=A0A9W8AXV7_9FUNG|nr:hypothetical protein IWQ62_001942 [Dispira parvispora]